jgi:hypothetical protein
VVTADLSFISLRTVAPVLAGVLAGAGADLVWLVKPQFEVGRRIASAGHGVVRDPEAWRGAVAGVHHALAESGAAMMGVMGSPLRGADGNVEFLLWSRAHTDGGIDPGGAIADALVAATATAAAPATASGPATAAGAASGPATAASGPATASGATETP